MPEFIDVHDGFVGVTQEQLAEAHRKDLEVEKTEGVHFKRWWADPVTGKVFCHSEGPSKEAVLRVHEKAGHPTKEIYEVKLSGE
ncbi:MAG: SCO4226 family nickel-binding protein [Dehalococcoidia bacterium]|nr:SCO4226 family nickel-binding protein [Dehalococcoidia bacterium]